MPRRMWSRVLARTSTGTPARSARRSPGPSRAAQSDLVGDGVRLAEERQPPRPRATGIEGRRRPRREGGHQAPWHSAHKSDHPAACDGRFARPIAVRRAQCATCALRPRWCSSHPARGDRGTGGQSAVNRSRPRAARHHRHLRWAHRAPRLPRGPADQVLGVIGPNGAGKTTLFNVACGFVRPLLGTSAWRGERLRRLRPHDLAGLGISRTLQGLGLFDRMTVLDNVLVGADRHARAGFLAGVALPRGRPATSAALRERAPAVLDDLASGRTPTATRRACLYRYARRSPSREPWSRARAAAPRRAGQRVVGRRDGRAG